MSLPMTAESARRIAQSSRRVAGRKVRPLGKLHTAFRVDVKARLFGIGRARQDNIGAMRAAIACVP